MDPTTTIPKLPLEYCKFPMFTSVGRKVHVYDFHVYYNPGEVSRARGLHGLARDVFPDLVHSRFWANVAIGPHPSPMFQIQTRNPCQLGALLCWLAVNRGPFSVLFCPDTGDETRDYTKLASWMGDKLLLDKVSLPHWRKNLEAMLKLQEIN